MIMAGEKKMNTAELALEVERAGNLYLKELRKKHEADSKKSSHQNSTSKGTKPNVTLGSKI